MNIAELQWVKKGNGNLKLQGIFPYMPELTRRKGTAGPYTFSINKYPIRADLPDEAAAKRFVEDFLVTMMTNAANQLISFVAGRRKEEFPDGPTA